MSVKVKVEKRDLGWAEFFRRAKEVRDRRVRVGVLSTDEHDPGGLTLAELAAVHEYGTEDGRVPERSYLRSTFDAEREELAVLGEKLIGAVLDGKMDVERGLGLIGQRLAGDVKNRIKARIAPPNKPATMARKGSDVPLIDESRLINAVTYAVEGEGEGE